MKVLRTGLAVALALTAVAGLGPASASAEECDGRVLNIVAHHDDDLLFLSPNLIHDIQDGKCVRTVFLIASDYPNGRLISDDEYMENRELGVRTAYADAADEDVENWNSEYYQPREGGKQATKWTLNDRLSIIELRISDDSTAPGSRLWWLYALDQPVTTRRGTDNDPQTFYRRQLGDFLREIVTDFGPDEIHAGDPLADHHTEANHPDHMATARLVRWALDGWAGAPRVEGYRDYSISDSPANLSEDEFTAKTMVFNTFAEHDYDICRPGSDCRRETWIGDSYRDWVTKQYYVDDAWREGYIEPLPVPYGDNYRPDPHIRGHYKIKNVATGNELAVLDASQENGAPLTTWTSTGTPNQTFEMRAHRGGWEISPLHSRTPGQDKWKCLDVPGKSYEDGKGVTQFDCSPDPQYTYPNLYPHQALRVIRQPAGNFELVFLHSNFRLTAPAVNGAPVTQQSYNGSDYQKWVFVPA